VTAATRAFALFWWLNVGKTSSRYVRFDAHFLVVAVADQKESHTDYVAALMESAESNLVILKQQSAQFFPPPKNLKAGFTWVLATDFSPYAKYALSVVLSLMGALDSLTIFYAAKYEAFAKRVQKYHEQELEKHNRCGEFLFEHVQGRQHFGQVICKVAESKAASILALGSRGVHSNTEDATQNLFSVANVVNTAKQSLREHDRDSLAKYEVRDSLGGVGVKASAGVQARASGRQLSSESESDATMVGAEAHRTIGNVSAYCADHCTCAMLIIKGRGDHEHENIGH
jgi:nucleotide-binding universal stress UspA family protein